ncbi:MAG: alpha/beta hydrolase [Lachnospiraceae bacterium]|nr:alpha/beta hydrolase [Lachnospiraceae bacterium]
MKQQKIKQKINHKIKQNKEQNIEQNNKQNIEPNKGSNKKSKLLKKSCILLLLFIAIILLRPTWTPDIKGENSISEFRKVEINGAKLQMMIRGCDKNNPVLLFVHGGPCWSEIPYVVKYQKEWEKEFTIVHYDQRGSGKSYQFFRDYSDVSANTHVEDLVALTEYIKEYLGQEQVVLVGHSYGTYVAIQAAYYRPELYRAYVGIGQVSHKVEAELDNLNKYIAAAEQAGNTKDVEYLKSLQEPITNGDILAPRAYARKYGFSARKINDNLDYLKGFLFGPEYNLLDAIRLYTASYLYQDNLLKESSDEPITELVTEMKIPVYFLMGKYDGMTSPKVAEEYLNDLIVEPKDKAFILFEESAHFPQFEEQENFFGWMKETFIQ